MASKPAARSASGANQILARLPQRELDRLAPHAEPIDLPLKHVFYERDQPIRFVYFLQRGVASLVRNLKEDEVVEIATVGNEGFVGIPLVLGDTRMTSRAFMQVPGDGIRIPAKAFAAVLEKSPVLRRRLLRCALALIAQISLAAACNRAHLVEQRCARWLLMTHDRVTSDTFPLTQEFLGQMLGVRRPTVSIAAGMLQRAKLITYVRGQITILDRKGLEGMSCECYHAITEEYRRLR
jgi:CRP-like cAMP-binding protein